MNNIAIGIAYVLIAGLILWVFLLSRTISKHEEKILLLTPPATPTLPVNPNGNGDTDSTSTGRQALDTVLAGDLWNSFQKNARELKMEVTVQK